MFEFSFERQVEPEQLLPLFQQTGWAGKRTLEGIRRMLAATPVALGAWQDDRLVGFARAITDGVYRALIDDVVVEKSVRGQGVGSELIQRLTERLADVETVFLRCGENVAGFYEKHRFRRSKGLVLDLTQTQSGQE